MQHYFVNNHAQSSGKHEVHSEECYFSPLLISKTSLGRHLDCGSAITKAKTIYSNADGCKLCCPDCQTGGS